MIQTVTTKRLQRFAASRPLLFAAGCLLIYGGYGWVGQTAKAAGSRWGAMGGELLAAVLAALILTGLGWWKRVDFAAPRWRSLWVVLPYLVYVAGGYRGVNTPWIDTLFIAVEAFLVGFQEEVWLRGIFLEVLRPRFRVYGAVIISSIMFGMLHLSNVFSGATIEGVILQMLVTLVFGLIAAGIRLRTGSIWVPVLLHAAVDFLSWVGSPERHGIEPTSPLVMVVMGVALIAYAVALVWGVVLEPGEHDGPLDENGNSSIERYVYAILSRTSDELVKPERDD